MRLPVTGVRPLDYPQVVFGAFHSRSRGRGAPSQHRRHRGRPRRPRSPARLTPPSTRWPDGWRPARARRTRSRSPCSAILSRGYAYNESPPVRAYPLVSFLFHDKIGYCQQFSGAMALLLRMGGVPARVSAGFTTGTRVGSKGPFVVTDIDAHAWVEAWFPGYGWYRFDPTPSAAPARGGQATLPINKNLLGAALRRPTAPRRDPLATAASARGQAAATLQQRSQPGDDCGWQRSSSRSCSGRAVATGPRRRRPRRAIARTRASPGPDRTSAGRRRHAHRSRTSLPRFAGRRRLRARPAAGSLPRVRSQSRLPAPAARCAANCARGWV